MWLKSDWQKDSLESYVLFIEKEWDVLDRQCYVMLSDVSSRSTGEFIVEVTVSNLVSSASLKGHVFVVLEPCQPPPVKNMGPSKIQVSKALIHAVKYSIGE